MVFGDWIWRAADIIIKLLSVIGGLYSSYQIYFLVKDKYFTVRKETFVLVDRSSLMKERQRQATILNDDEQFSYNSYRNDSFLYKEGKYNYDDNIHRRINV